MEKVRDPNFLKGTIFIIIAFFFMALFGVVSKIAALTESVLWVSFLMYVFAFLLLLPVVAYQGFDTLKTKLFPLHFLRAFVGLSASMFYLLAITKVPLANASLLYSTSPFFIPLISLVFFHYKLSLVSWVAIFIGFFGITLIIRPNLAVLDEPGNLYGLISGILLAIVFVIVGILSKTENVLTILFYFAAIGSLLQLPLVLLDMQHVPAINSIPIIISLSAIFILTQFFIAIAYLYAHPADIGIFQYLTILFVGILDWAIWDSVPSYLDLIGAAIVVLAGIITIRQGYGLNSQR